MTSFDFTESLVSVTDTKGKIIRVNEKFCEVSKFKKDELLGKTHSILKSGHHPMSFYKSLWDTLIEGKIWSGLIKNKTKQGEFYWVKSTMIPVLDLDGNPIQFVCISEITNFEKKRQIKNIQNALDESSIVAITDINGNITYANKKFCEISKYSEKELLGKNHRILKSGHHSSKFYDDMWKTISNGNPWNGVIKNKAKDGTFYWVRTTIVPTFDKNHDLENYIAIRTDITSQIELEEKLLKAEKLSSIGELASRMSHDLRNPLSIIQVSVENLKSLYGTDATKQNQFEKIKRSITRMTHQIDNVLDFVREKPVKLEQESLTKIISDSLDSLIIPDNIKLIYPNNDVELVCDKIQLSTALNNLILNGIQSIDGIGTIEITVEENDEIIIQVKDSGSGISKEDLNKIFEPLYTTKMQGTGLGLASVRSIIDAHGGIVSVTSPPVIFTITLPKILD